MRKRQINVWMSEEWIEQLEKMARQESVKENKNINHLDLIRQAVKEKYELND